jgi:hypothetical protein
MYTAIAGILLSLVLMLFNIRLSAAEIWACPQANGSTLYTNEPQAESSCEKFEPVGRVTYLPPRIWAGPPLSDVAYEKQEITEADAPPASSVVVVEPAALPSDAGESYNARQDSFWNWGESPIVAYTYVFNFNGTRASRHMRHRDFLRHPRKQHGLRHNLPLWDQSARLNAPKHGRANSPRGGAPQIIQPQAFSPASSAHVRGGSFGTAPPVAPARPSGFKPQMRR